MAEGAESKDEVEAQVEVAENDEGKEEHLELQPEQETMRSVVLTGYGGIHKLQVQKYAKPKPMNGQVVIRVHACGLNFADIAQRQGLYPSPRKPPFIPGMECSGTVEELGEGVTGLEVGSRVTCLTTDGAWSEYTCIAASLCFVIPESMSFEDAAALPITYLTAYLMLFHCSNLGVRKSVLIHMAAGGVGVAATQLCKTVEGVTTFGTASASKHETILANGITHAIDYRTMDYVQAVKKVCPEGVDIVLDPLGGVDTKKGYSLLKPLGILVCFGMVNGISESKGVFNFAKNWFQGVTFNPTHLMKENKTVCGFILRELLDNHELLHEAMKHLIQLHNEGKIKPVIDEVFALEEVGKAMLRIHERKNVGKIILSPMKEPEPKPEPAAASPAEPTVTKEEEAKTEENEAEEKTDEEKEETKGEEEKKEDAAA